MVPELAIPLVAPTNSLTQKVGLWRLSAPMVARVIVGRDVDGCIEHIG